MDRQTLTEKFFSLRERKDTLNKELKSINQEIEEIENQLISTMENEGLEMFRDSRFGTVFLEADLHASIEDEFQAFEWIRKHGYGDVIKERIMPSTLTALVKEVPEQIPGIKTYDFTKVKIRRNSKS